MRLPSVVFLVALAFLPREVAAQGDPLGPEFRVNTYTTNNQSSSAVATASSGDFLVVWTSDGQDGSNFGVFGQRYSASGVPVGAEFRVNTYTTSYQAAASADVDSSGNFIVVWESNLQDGSTWGVFGQRYAAPGAPLGPEFRVNSFTTGTQVVPRVSSDAAGSFVVVWWSYGQDGSGFGVFGQRYASSGTPIGPEFRINTFTTADQDNASVAGDASGNFVVVWASAGQDRSDHGIFGQRYAAGGTPLGPEFRVNTHTTDSQTAPSVAVDASGGFVVTWQSYIQDGSNFGIYGQRYSSLGVPLGSEFPVNSYTTNYQEMPAVAADPSGNFVIVWSSLGQDGSGHGIFGKRYTSSGVPLTGDFRVNTFTTDVQFLPSVGADASGNFIVAWTSGTLQEGSGSGVFGQRYAPILPVELMHFRVE
jgi:hypothetical protein